MSEIFVSYARNERDRVAPLVSMLEANGYKVWWDRELAPGDSFSERINDELMHAKCVVVVWSEASIGSKWVNNEALDGFERNILVPVQLDDVRIPVPFKQTQCARFVNWPAQQDEGEVRLFLAAIKATLNGDALPDRLYPESTASRPASEKSRRMLALGALVVCLMGVMSWIGFRYSSEPETRFSPDIRNVAVLAFNDTRKDIQTSVAEVLNADLVQMLHKVTPFSVTDLSTFTRVAETRGMVTDIDRFIEGTISANGDMLHIEIALLDKDGHSIWKNEYRRTLESLFDLSHEVAVDIGTAMNVSTVSIGKVATTNSAAYREYLKGQDQFRRGESDNLLQAVELFENAISLDPEFSVAFASKCRVLLRLYVLKKDMKDFESAEKSCHRALTLESDFVDIYLALGDLYTESGQYGKAESEYRKALELDNSRADAWIGLGSIATANNKLAESENALIKATSVQPAYWKAFNELGSFYFRQGLYFKASENYQRVSMLSPSSTFAFNNLGAARFYAGEVELAAEAWQRANEIMPDAVAFSNLGYANFFLGRFDAAVVLFTQARDLSPEDHRIWGNLADALRYQVAGTEKSLAAYSRAVVLATTNVEINPRDTDSYSRLAIYHAVLGNDHLALESIARSLSQAPDDFLVLYDVAVAYTVLGQTELAVDSIEAAVKAGYPLVLIKSDPQFESLILTRRYRELFSTGDNGS